MRQIKIPGYYAGIFLVSLSTLMFEISLTRICSVIMWYHFAFMVISIALLGFAASGAFLAVFPKIIARDIYKTPALLAILFSTTILMGLAVINRLLLDPFQIINNPAQLTRLCIFYIVLIIPFFFSGLCTAFFLSKMPDKAGKIYFSNMLGSGFGCFLTVFVIPLFSNAGAVAAAALFVLAAALCFNSNVSKRLTIAAAVLILFFLPVLFNAKHLFKFRIAESKSLSVLLSGGAVSRRLTTWNVFSQVDVIPTGNLSYAPGLSSRYSRKLIPQQAILFIDADANTPITRFNGNMADLAFLKFVPSSVAYELRKKSDVCIIGAGGGYDVLAALSVGEASQVTAIEMNPDVIAMVKNYFKDLSGDIYRFPRVNLKHAEGRSFIHNTANKYDVIQLSLVDTWAAASTGAYSLAENYLYTQEAFMEYINHLKEDGILTFTRWMLIPPKETLRLSALAVSALERLGVARPENNIVMIESSGVGVLLAKRTQFEPSEIKRIQNICDQSGFKIVYAPGIVTKNVFYEFFHTKDKNIFYKEYPFNVTPSSDDKPFFFHYYNLKQGNLFQFWKLTSIDRNNISYLILIAAFLQAFVLSLVLILAPLYWAKRKLSGKVSLSQLHFLVYFSCLGMAFMFIEVSLIQKFILFLGQPVYSLSVVMFSLLFFAGIGSLMSSRINRPHLATVINVLTIMILAYSFFLPRLSYFFIGWTQGVRFFISILLLAPLGFLLGIPFPLGLRLMEDIAPKSIPLAWGCNGCFSVMGSIVSVIIAMSFGFSVVLWCAAFIYLISAVVVKRFLIV